MATQVAFQGVQQTLESAVRGWDRRLRLRDTLIWLPRALAVGLVAGIVFAVISRLRTWLLPDQIIALTVGAVALSVAIMLALVWLRPRPLIVSARHFDVLFGLDERVSTALELVAGRIHADAALTAAQVDDAQRRALAVRPGDTLRLRWIPRDWLIMLALLALFALLVLLPNPQAEAIAGESAERGAIDEATDTLREAAEQVATDPFLDAADRESLLQTLDTSIETLEQPDISPEEAFASISDAQAALREQAEYFNQQLNNRAAAMDAAAQALGDLSPEMQQALDAAESRAEAMRRMMEQLAEQMANMSESQRQQAAQALQQAAQQMQGANPQAAGQMQQAADSLQQGQTGDAQQALESAQNSLQQDQQAQAAQQNSAQQLSDSAQQAGEAAQSVAQAAQQSDQAPQQGQQSQSGEQQGQQGQQGQSGEQQGQQGQQGQSGDQGQPGGQQGDQPGQQGQPGGQQPGGETGQTGATQSDGQSDEAAEGGQSQQGGAGAGDQPGGAGSESGSRQAGEPSASNNPDGTGEREFAPVFAPRRIGGDSGGEQVFLEPDGSNSPVIEGEFADNPAGESLVPYNEVYADYANSANRALESDYIPLGLRDVVRDYFTALEPGGSGD